jgi:cytochrome c peroxidase
LTLVVAIVALGLVGGLALPVSNLFWGYPKGSELARLARGRSDVARTAATLEKSCANCHSADVALPFYAGVPVVGSIIKADVERGQRAFDLVHGLFPTPEGPPNEAALAKIEHVVDAGRMPPMPYVTMHWESRIGAADREALLRWVRSTRARHFAYAGLSPELAAAAVRPLREKVPVEAAKVALGKQLYFDKRLSGDDSISCATCHDLTKGGSDQEPVSTGIHGQKGGINDPSTFNALFAIAQFWDGRAATLEDQAGGPPLNPIEMGGTWEGIATKLGADEAFSTAFRQVYPDGFSAKNITDAIAEYERTLITPGAPFDLFLRGDQSALDAEARRGWERFQAEGCHTCHVGEVLGGQSFELLGQRRDYFAELDRDLTDADHGRFNVTKVPRDRHRFKVPILRNVALTFPYFHDASAADLSAAVRTMGRFNTGVEFADGDVAGLVAFLESLTGTFEGRSLAP